MPARVRILPPAGRRLADARRLLADGRKHEGRRALAGIVRAFDGFDPAVEAKNISGRG